MINIRALYVRRWAEKAQERVELNAFGLPKDAVTELIDFACEAMTTYAAHAAFPEVDVLLDDFDKLAAKAEKLGLK